MSSSSRFPEFVPIRTALEPGWLERAFPDSDSIEIFGAPGAGKSFFSREMSRTAAILSTADNQVLQQFARKQMWGAPHVLERIVGLRIMKNLYKVQIDQWCEAFWRKPPPKCETFIGAVTNAIHLSEVPHRTERNVTKSIRLNGLALAMAQEKNHSILVDEGFVRKLVTLLVQSRAVAAPEVLFPPLRICLEQYPWERNTLFIDAPTEVCVDRQNARGHVVHGPTKRQPDQRTAAKQIFNLCVESGWNVQKIWNDVPLRS